MLRHFGVRRTYKHNLRVAVLLSLVAGFVNAAGFLGFFALTTNVTGHAALFAEEIATGNWANAATVAVWMLLFLIGAWTTSMIITKMGHHQRYSFAIPILLELLILICCAFFGSINDLFFTKGFFVGILLFAMGLQNALVSVISGSVVRTTHLTGTFTDLGIELAQIKPDSLAGQQELLSKIKLRLSIILFFMLGALSGAYLFRYLHFSSFYLPCFILCFTLYYDVFRLRVTRFYSMLIRQAKIK